MRFHRAQLFLGITALIAIAAVAYCCGDYGAGRKIVLAAGAKVPANIGRSIISGNRLVALTTDGRLVAVDLAKGEMKDLGGFDMKLTQVLDVINDKACIASKNRVYVVDLVAGKIVQSGVCDGDIHSLGFLSLERVYLHNGVRVSVLDLPSGRMIHDVVLGKADARLANGGFRTLGRSGNRLLVSIESDKEGVAIVDLEKGEVTDRISAPQLRLHEGLCSVTDIHFAGDKVHVLCSRFSYGVWADTFGYFDLKTRKYTGLKLPANNLQQPTLVAGPEGTLFMACINGVYQYDAAGKVHATILSKREGRLLGMWNGQALVSHNEELRQVRLPTVTAQAQ